MMDGEKRLCKCGHNIWYHEDWDRDIHECNYRGCECRQFGDVEEILTDETKCGRKA